MFADKKNKVGKYIRPHNMRNYGVFKKYASCSGGVFLSDA